MEAREFLQYDVQGRYAQLMSHGHLLATLSDHEYMVHLYFLEKFYVELRLDPVRYVVISADVFDESHPRYLHYMDRIKVDTPSV